MIKQYLGIDLQKIGIFLGLIIAAASVTTIIYWLIYGFDKWKSDIQMSANLMMAAAVAPVAQGYSANTASGQYICPQHGAVGLPNFDASGSPYCPLCGKPMQFNSLQANNLSVAAWGGG